MRDNSRRHGLRTLLHLISVALLLPNLLLACGFLLLGHAVAGAGIFDFIYRALSSALWLVTWGALGFAVAMIAIVACGVTRRWRWLGALCVALLSLVSGVVVIALGAGSYSVGQWFFLSPGVVSLGIGGWLSWSEWPGSLRNRNHTQRVDPHP